LILLRALLPSILTHRSLGNDRIATWLSIGLTRTTMIVSLLMP